MFEIIRDSSVLGILVNRFDSGFVSPLGCTRVERNDESEIYKIKRSSIFFGPVTFSIALTCRSKAKINS